MAEDKKEVVKFWLESAEEDWEFALGVWKSEEIRSYFLGLFK
jgi:hypothetical protein